MTLNLTTAIHYTNGCPHLGHAYEVIAADIIARYHRLLGDSVHFLTGTDEYGQKIAKTAESMGLSPQQLCDQHSQRFNGWIIDCRSLTIDSFAPLTHCIIRSPS